MQAIELGHVGRLRFFQPFLGIGRGLFALLLDLLLLLGALLVDRFLLLGLFGGLLRVLRVATGLFLGDPGQALVLGLLRAGVDLGLLLGTLAFFSRDLGGQVLFFLLLLPGLLGRLAFGGGRRTGRSDRRRVAGGGGRGGGGWRGGCCWRWCSS